MRTHAFGQLSQLFHAPAAAHLRAAGVSTLLVDTAPQAQASAQALALALGAQYLALPYAGANTLNQAVRAVAGRA